MNKDIQKHINDFYSKEEKRDARRIKKNSNKIKKTNK